jgi:hypothetical protein
MIYTSLSPSITVIDMQGTPISAAQHFLEVMMNAPADNLVVYQKDLPDSFFDLKSGLAGDILQKVANYRRRLAIVGDFSKYESKSLRDLFMRATKEAS